jgi:hypothetical protein
LIPSSHLQAFGSWKETASKYDFTAILFFTSKRLCESRCHCHCHRCRFSLGMSRFQTSHTDLMNEADSKKSKEKDTSKTPKCHQYICAHTPQMQNHTKQRKPTAQFSHITLVITHQIYIEKGAGEPNQTPTCSHTEISPCDVPCQIPKLCLRDSLHS